MSALVTLRGLSKTYDIAPVLRKIDLEIDRGEIVGLLGANGSGKSTLLRLLAGLSKPSSGTIQVGGWELPREAAAVRAQIGMVGHKGLLYDNLTAQENLQFFAGLYNVSAADRDGRITHLLKRVGLERRANDRVRGFSRGMLQRLSIARALLHQPDVLLFDEPYTGLDQEGNTMLDAVIEECRQVGRTVVMSTHDLDRAARLSTRIIILARGRIGVDMAAESLDGPGLAALYARTTGRTLEVEGQA